MEQKTLSKWLKIVIAVVGICGLIVYLLVIPNIGDSILYDYPEFSGWFWPWLIFLWITAVPCYMVLYFGWKIATKIGKNHSFSMDNANYLKWVSGLAAGDSAFFFAGNIVLWLLGMNHPGVILVSLLITFAGVAVTIVAAVLSHLVRNAAVLQEQSDLTI